MPPGSIYTLYSGYFLNIEVSKIILKVLHKAPGSLPWINGSLQDSFLRFPSIFGDLGIGVLLYLMVAKIKSEKAGIIASSLFLLNPVIIYNSTFWGQMDGVNNFFIILSLFFLYKKKLFLSIFSFFISIYVKLSLLPLAPILFLMVFLICKRIRNGIYFFIASISISIIIIFIFTLPISLVPHIWFFNFARTNALPEGKNITSFAFNFWWVILKPYIVMGKPTNLFNFSEVKLFGSPLGNQLFWGLSLSFWGYLIFTLANIPLIYTIISSAKKMLRIENIFLTSAITMLLAFMFLPYMHERYLYPFFPMFAVYVGISGRFLNLYLSLSLLNLLNLYIVWHPMMIGFLPYSLMNNQTFQWWIALMTLVISILFYIKFAIGLHYKNKQSIYIAL